MWSPPEAQYSNLDAIIIYNSSGVVVFAEDIHHYKVCIGKEEMLAFLYDEEEKNFWSSVRIDRMLKMFILAKDDLFGRQSVEALNDQPK